MTSWSEDLTVTLVTSAGAGPTPITVAFPGTDAARPRSITIDAGGSTIRPTRLKGIGFHAPGSDFAYSVSYFNAGETWSGTATVPLARIQSSVSGQIQVASPTRRRDVHTLNTTLDFGGDGNVQITVDMTPVAEDANPQAFSMHSGSSESDFGDVVWEEVQGSFEWSGGSVVPFAIGYDETRNDIGTDVRTMTTSTALQPVPPSTTTTKTVSVYEDPNAS